MTDYLCPICGGIGVPDDTFTLIDQRYAPGKCMNARSLGQNGNHGNRHLTLLRRDIYEASRLSRTGRVREVRQPVKQETLLDGED